MQGGDQAEGLRRLLYREPLKLSLAVCEEEVLATYARIKHHHIRRGVTEFSIAVRGAASDEEARRVFERLREVAGAYLGVRLHYRGRDDGQ
ncbi:MAG: hypothetical protein N2441_03510 [Rhodocyclaceae bacterium]|nr:hypothetical protein [Rhodocyclaceae bacterium]